jgi:peptide/nickel transport system permease protein
VSSGSGSLSRYILVRILLIIPMLWVVLTMVFFMLRVAPGDPVSAAFGGRLSQEALDVRREALGLDRPLIVQYLEYLGQVARLNFGTTVSDNRQVFDVIRDQGGATLTLTIGAFVFALAVGLPLGRLAGRYRDTGADAGIRIFGVVTYAAPIFWVGIMLVLLVVELFPGWPTSGIATPITIFTIQPQTHILLVDSILAGDSTATTDVLKHHLLPCFTLGLLLCGVIIRLVRVNVIQAMKGDYVEAARARGISERNVVRRHAFRNALVPVITVIGLLVALTLGGAVLTERTFNWPGIGNELIQYLNARDYIAVQGLVTFFAVVVVLCSLAVDIINALIDPRVRY